MKRLLLITLLLLTAFLTAVERFCGCPLLFAPGVLYVGLGLTIAATVFSFMLHYKLKDILWCIAGGVVCTATVNAMLCVIVLARPYLSEDSRLLLEFFLMCIYMALTAVGAIHVYLYFFCGFNKIIKQID